MGQNLSGFPRTIVTISDLSIIIANSLKGIWCIQIVTQRGEPGKQYLIGNSTQFKRELGDVVDGDDGALVAMRALDNGATLRVTRAFHYTTITDISTAEGTKAIGNITVTTDVINFIASAVGPGYDDIAFATSVASSGGANLVDITITIPGIAIPQVITDFPQVAPTAGDIATANAKLKHVQIASVVNNVPIGSGVLGGGVQDLNDIVQADFAGDQGAGNGWHAFDNVTDSMRIANIAVADPDYDVDLTAYVDARGDMTAQTRTALGLTADGIQAYRDGTAPYTHTAIDSHFMRLLVSDVEINDPADAEVQKDITGLGDVMGLISKTDQRFGEWFSSAGKNRGKLVGVNGVGPVNLGSPGYSAQADVIYEKGVNAIIETNGSVKYWGNRTLLKDKTKLLSKANISDLVVFIARTVKGIAEMINFDPNDPVSWNLLYRTVRPFITDTLVKGRAIRGLKGDPNAGEGKVWHWFGDQDAKEDLSDLTFNTISDIDAGKYRVRFAFVPISAIEYIAVDIAPTDTQTIQNVTQLTTV